MEDNEALKQVFKKLHAKITKNVKNPNSVINELFSNDVIDDDDNDTLYSISDPASRCGKLFSLLHRSSHPETFIQLRLALLEEYPSIVAEVDEQLSSLTTHQPKQSVMSHSTEGKLLLSLSVFLMLLML